MAIRVRPGSGKTAVGGVVTDPTHGTMLVVRVKEPAVEGRANEAALRALSEALGVRRSDLTMVRALGRIKYVEVDTSDEAGVQARIEALGRAD